MKNNASKNVVSGGAKARAEARGLGLGLVTGSQDVTLSDQDAMATVIAEPDFSEVHAAFTEASERVANAATSLDFSTNESVASSLNTIWMMLDHARRASDLSLTRQYEHERAQLDRREASYKGQLAQLTEELSLLEDELASMAKAS